MTAKLEARFAGSEGAEIVVVIFETQEWNVPIIKGRDTAHAPAPECGVEDVALGHAKPGHQLQDRQSTLAGADPLLFPQKAFKAPPLLISLPAVTPISECRDQSGQYSGPIADDFQ